MSQFAFLLKAKEINEEIKNEPQLEDREFKNKMVDDYTFIYFFFKSYTLKGSLKEKKNKILNNLNYYFAGAFGDDLLGSDIFSDEFNVLNILFFDKFFFRVLEIFFINVNFFYIINEKFFFKKKILNLIFSKSIFKLKVDLTTFIGLAEYLTYYKNLVYDKYLISHYMLFFKPFSRSSLFYYVYSRKLKFNRV
jgi:hypothetical protein